MWLVSFNLYSKILWHLPFAYFPIPCAAPEVVEKPGDNSLSKLKMLYTQAKELSESEMRYLCLHRLFTWEGGWNLCGDFWLTAFYAVQMELPYLLFLRNSLFDTLTWNIYNTLFVLTCYVLFWYFMFSFSNLKFIAFSLLAFRVQYIQPVVRPAGCDNPRWRCWATEKKDRCVYYDW